jgi:hypothetical protein
MIVNVNIGCLLSRSKSSLTFFIVTVFLLNTSASSHDEPNCSSCAQCELAMQAGWGELLLLSVQSREMILV